MNTKIVAHDGMTEWADCPECGARLNGASMQAPKDWDGSCWRCGCKTTGLRVPVSDPRPALKA